MKFFNRKIEDKKLGDKFIRKFPFVIVAKDLERGKIVLIFKSKRGYVLEVGTDQEQPQVVNKDKK